ncbi:MAG: hypothetical protein WDO14_07025 [Bacteroidota bacterium]
MSPSMFRSGHGWALLSITIVDLNHEKMDVSKLVQDIYTESTDIRSSYFLPVAILDQPQGADPWQIPALTIGDLASIDPTLPANICNTISGGKGTSPSSAIMKLSDVKIAGLSNAVMAQPTINGSTVNVNITFGGASMPPGISSISNVQVSAQFTINLPCSGGPQTVTGTLQTTLTNSNAAFVLTIGADCSAVVNSIAFTASASKTYFVINPTNGAIGSLLNTAFGTPPGQSVFMACIGGIFSSPASLTTLGSILTPILQTAGNQTILSFVVSQLSNDANDPTKPVFLPQKIKGASSPVLDPYIVNDQWPLGDVSGFYPSAGMTICGSIGATQGLSEISTPGSAVDLTLSGIQIAGASNAFVYPLLVAGNDINALAVFGQVNNWTPAKLVVSGNFSISVSCCQTLDFQYCSSPSTPYVGTGTFSATFAKAGLTANILVSVQGVSPKDQKLVATVTSIEFLCDPNILDENNLVFDVNITSIPAGQSAQWDAMVEKLFNSPEGATAIVGQIKAQMNQSTVLGQISAIVTNALSDLLQTTDKQKLFEQVMLVDKIKLK